MTEASWYYATGDQSYGPALEADLGQKFANGSLGLDTLVWTDGMAEWQPADSVPAFASIVSDEIEEVDAEEVDAQAWDERPSRHQTPRQTLYPSPPEPWRRYLARQLDTVIFSFLCLSVVGPVSVADNFGGSFFLVFVLIGWALVEGILISVVGYTFGKWLMQIEVTDAYGYRLGLKQSLRRSFDVLFRGMGLGLPMLNVFVQLFSLHQLTTKGITLWDRDGHCVVRHPTQLDPARWVALIALIILLLKASSQSMPLVS